MWVRYVQSTSNGQYGFAVTYGGSGRIESCIASNKSVAAVQAAEAAIISISNISGTGNAVGLMAGSSGSCGTILVGSNVTLTGTTQESIYGGSQITSDMANLNNSTPRTISAGTTDMTAGTTALATGTIYLMYE